MTHTYIHTYICIYIHIYIWSYALQEMVQPYNEAVLVISLVSSKRV